MASSLAPHTHTHPQMKTQIKRNYENEDFVDYHLKYFCQKHTLYFLSSVRSHSVMVSDAVSRVCIFKAQQNKRRRRHTRSGGGCCWFWLFPPVSADPCELLLAFAGLAGASRGLFLSTARKWRSLSVWVAGTTFNMVPTHRILTRHINQEQ